VPLTSRLLAAAVALAPATALAQTDPLAGDGDSDAAQRDEGTRSGVDHGGWGAPTWAFMPVQGGVATLEGGRGGWLIDHRWTLGGHAQSGRGPGGGRLHYSGVFIERTVQPDRPLHATFSGSWGAGQLRTEEQRTPIQVLQGAAHLEGEITSWMRIAAGPAYRAVLQGESAPLRTVEHAIGGELVLKFGRF
jgi:hypothetical protein